MIKSSAICKTFWNEIRAEQGKVFKDLAAEFNVSAGTVNSWFTGRRIPNDSEIKRLCEIFNVSKTKGRNEFIKAHEAWKSDHGVSDVNEQQEDFFDLFNSEDLPIEIMDEPSEDPTEDSVEDPTEDFAEEACRQIYGKVDYETYEAFKEAVAIGGDPLASIYGKVSFEAFNELLNILSR